jgi:hypothetical protein
MHTPSEIEEFWSDSYRGHTIATLNRGNGWLVYLDHVPAAQQAVRHG